MTAPKGARPDKGKNYRAIGIGLSIIIIVTVFLLLFLPGQGEDVDLGFDLKILPLMNAVFNSIAFIFLVLALAAIRRKKVETHKRFILAAVVMSTLFLITYVTYHYLAPSTPYGGEGRSEEHTSELQSRPHLVCRLLLEKKKQSSERSLFSRPDLLD